MRTLVSKKLRAGIVFSLVNLVPVESPAVRMAMARKTLEFLDAALGIVPASYRLQVIADQLVKALAEGLGFLPGARDELLINGEGDVHFHSIRAHILRVNCPETRI